MAHWHARSRVWVCGSRIESPPTPSVSKWGRACATPKPDMEAWAVHLSIIVSLRFEARFGPRFGFVLGSSRAPFGTIFETEIELGRVKNHVS